MSLGAVTTALGQVGLTLVAIAFLVAVLEGVLYVLLVRLLKWRHAVPIMLVAPAAVGLTVLIVYPLLWELNVSFTKMSLRNFGNPGFLGLDQGWFVGLDNYKEVFTLPVLKLTGFWQLLGQTVLWTAANVSLHVLGGMALALLLHRQMRGKGIYRALIVLPWAMPQVIALLIWRTEYNFEFGAVNQLLGIVGIEPIRWLSDPFWNFLAMIITNVWLGIPFMMVIILGGLQSISADYYEAAEVDGATSRQSFRHITLPLLRPVLTPAIILGTVWTFNNINVPYFINQNELETSDILVTAIFREAFQYNRYGDAAAFAFVVFLLLLVFTVFYIRVTGSLKGAYE
ncbi:MAG TPA: sugar ABC transporter permease [Candidatus Limnocylindrales bacterium]|nr:sugar ABC transporter permease [Candidatus Limnocylindrales bacterium]